MMTTQEALKIFFDWAREHEEVASPFPVYHKHAGRWSALIYRDGGVYIEWFDDSESALIAVARALSKD